MFGREKSKADANSMLHVRIVEAKNLIAHDAGNTSDPYCTVRIGFISFPLRPLECCVAGGSSRCLDFTRIGLNFAVFLSVCWVVER